MELIDAYDISEQAESLVLKRQYKDASRLYKQASELFAKQIDRTHNKEINNALKILVEDYLKRSLELSTLENIKSPLKKGVDPAYSNNSVLGPGLQRIGLGTSTVTQGTNNKLSASLAMARGIPGPSLDVLTGSFEDIEGANNSISTGGDPLQKLTVQLLNLLKVPKLKTINEQSEIQIKASGKTLEELEYENVHLKQLISNYSENLQIYETTNKKVARNIQVYISNFKKELTINENRRILELERKVEALQNENKEISKQKEKLNQRWDELVKSAKKRKEGNTGNINKNNIDG